RQPRVLEVDARERIGAREARPLEVGQALARRARVAEPARVRGAERRLQGSKLGGVALGAGPEGHEAEGQRPSLRGAVEDLPIAELAAATERDRARADPAERERDLGEGVAGERALGAGAEEVLGAIGDEAAGGRAKGLRRLRGLFGFGRTAGRG